MTEQEIRDIARQAMREVVTIKNAVDEAMEEKAGTDRMSELESAVNLLSEAIKELKEASSANACRNADGEPSKTPEEEEKIVS